MAEVAIAAIVVGAILFAFGLFPGLPLALMEALLMEAFQNLRDQFFRSKGGVHRFQTDLPLSSDAWLVGSGGVMLILGLFVLLR